jgi:hypothetical protein
VTDISIPSWMEELAPGAAQAARNISSGTLARDPLGAHGAELTAKKRERLQRLVNHCKYNGSNEAAWGELNAWRGKERPSDIEVWIAQYELFRAAFRAPDLPPITKTEIRERKAALAGVAKRIVEATGDLDRIVASDEIIATQLADFWQTFRTKYGFAEGFYTVFDLLGTLGYFIDDAAKHIKHAGPAPHLDKMRGKNAKTRASVRHIAETCEQLFGSPMYETVAKLASASLGRTVSIEIVRNSLRSDAGRKSAARRRLRHGGHD